MPTNPEIKLEKDKYYRIKINVYGREITYEGKVAYLEKNEFGFKTENATCPLQFYIKDIISAEEIPAPKKSPIVIKKQIRLPKHLLKESEKPEGL